MVNSSWVIIKSADNKLTQPEADTRPGTFGKGENARPAIGQVVCIGHAGRIEPALGDKRVRVGAPDALQAIDGARGDVDDLALCDWDLVEDVLAVGRADWPA